MESLELIANTGIQLYVAPTAIDPDSMNSHFRMYFHESFCRDEGQLKLEIAHYFENENVWVNKRDLLELGYLSNGTVDNDMAWKDMEDDFRNDGRSPVTVTAKKNHNTVYANSSVCLKLSIRDCSWDKFENRWLPLPYFEEIVEDEREKSIFGPTNWCRMKLIPCTADGHLKKYNVLLAFDTRSAVAGNQPQDEIPVFEHVNQASMNFSLCHDEFLLLSYCSKLNDCEWVDEYILKTLHGMDTTGRVLRNQPATGETRLTYLAKYICLVNYIQKLNVLPKVALHSGRNAAPGDIDMVIDIGNSRTCAMLFDNSYDGNNRIFTKVDMLALQNFTVPVKNGQLNIQEDSFDMRLAFREADFGGELKRNSLQFVYPSLVRAGMEATHQLINEASDLEEDLEKNSIAFSPKRYLWDDREQQREWRFITLAGETKNDKIYVKGISCQFNADGTLSDRGDGGIEAKYSRKSLMTFAFLEILAQAYMQINNEAFRKKRGGQHVRRRINRLIITCPTTMSRFEQSAMRKCAEDASSVFHRFYNETGGDRIIEVIPSCRNLPVQGKQKEWIYDEASCFQFVFLYAEISKRYLNNCRAYFDLYGKTGNDPGGDSGKSLTDSGKSLTVGSIDFGAGSVDVIISSYRYDTSQQCSLMPVPLFYESFYTNNGDDLLKEMIRQVIIEGSHAAIQKRLDEMYRESHNNMTTGLINRFFGENNAAQANMDRQVRKKFNLQVSIPVVEFYLELLKQNKVEEAELKFEDIFSDNKPAATVLNHFRNHFGFALEEIKWHYKRETVAKVVRKVFDPPIRTISTLLSYYSCDFVLISGRPALLKPLSDLFLKYYAVAPNRLITLNSYRVGNWYPFNNDNGYVRDAKTIVPVGAMIGYYASTGSEMTGFSLQLDGLRKKLLPTSDYFAVLSDHTDESFMTPKTNTATIQVNVLPVMIGCRQYDIPAYPSRPLYRIALDVNAIEKRCGIDGVNAEINRIRSRMPLKIMLARDFQADREKLHIISVQDEKGNELPLTCFTLQYQSISESDSHWLETGEFANLNITNINN